VRCCVRRIGRECKEGLATSRAAESSTASRGGRGIIAIASRSVDFVFAAGFLTFSMMLSTVVVGELRVSTSDLKFLSKCAKVSN
jgi:hypothetical protein